MDIQLLIMSAYEVLLSIVFGLLTIYLTKKFLNAFARKSDTDAGIAHGNLALAIYRGTVVLCVLLLTQPSILPAITTLQTIVLGHQGFSAWMFMTSFAYFILFYVIATVISIIAIFCGAAIYSYATRPINEMEEIHKNNVAISVMFSMAILGMTLFIQPSVNRLIGSLVNYNMLEQNAGSVSNK